MLLSLLASFRTVTLCVFLWMCGLVLEHCGSKDVTIVKDVQDQDWQITLVRDADVSPKTYWLGPKAQ